MNEILLGVAGGAILFLLGVVQVSIFSALGNIKSDHKDLSRSVSELPEKYVLKVDLRDAIEHIFQLLTQIDTKLDRKADK